MSQDAVNRQLKKMKGMDKENAINLAGTANISKTTNNSTISESTGIVIDMGRQPMGTTINASNLQFQQATSDAKEDGKRLPRGCLYIIIKAVLTESKLAIDETAFEISKDTIRS